MRPRPRRCPSQCRALSKKETLGNFLGHWRVGLGAVGVCGRVGGDCEARAGHPVRGACVPAGCPASRPRDTSASGADDPPGSAAPDARVVILASVWEAHRAKRERIRRVDARASGESRRLATRRTAAPRPPCSTDAYRGGCGGCYPSESSDRRLWAILGRRISEGLEHGNWLHSW